MASQIVTKMKPLIFLLLFSLGLNAQTTKIRETKSSIEIENLGRTYSYDYIVDNSMSATSYLISSDGDSFYIKYEFHGSARTILHYIVKFDWKNETIFLSEFIKFENREGVWKCEVRLIKPQKVRNSEELNEIIFSEKLDDQTQNHRVITSNENDQLAKLVTENVVLEDKILMKILHDSKH